MPIVYGCLCLWYKYEDRKFSRFVSFTFRVINIGVAPIKHLRTCVIKIVTLKGGQCGKSDLPYHKELLLQESVCSLWEQILSFYLEKGRN